MEIVEPGWGQTFYDLAQKSKDRIVIVSPLIGEDPSDELLKIIDTDNIDLNIITRFNERLFKAETSSIEALRKLVNNKAKLYMLKKLNAKIYCFDENRIIITSSNFTLTSLNECNEYGILLKKEEDKDFKYIQKKIEKFIDSAEEIKQMYIDETYQRVENSNKINIHQATKYDADQGIAYNDKKLNIELLDNINKSKVNKLITEIEDLNSKFENNSEELKKELEDSNYKTITPEMYIWLIVWSNSGGPYKRAVPKVEELCDELFGYQSDNEIEVPGREINLKDYRYEDELPENIRNSVLKYHYYNLE